jgi:microcompartment protein CcmL/EutN
MSAIGFIETRGLLAAIEAADVMLKAASVRLLGRNLAGGGLVTVSVAGEVAAVSSSVDAAAAAVLRIRGTALVSRHVIARPDAELARVIAIRPREREKEPAAEPRARQEIPPGGELVPEARTAAHPDVAAERKEESETPFSPQPAGGKGHVTPPGAKASAPQRGKKKKYER